MTGLPPPFKHLPLLSFLLAAVLLFSSQLPVQAEAASVVDHAAQSSAETLAQTRRLLNAMGIVQAGEMSRGFARLYEPSILKRIIVSPDDLDRVRQVLLEATVIVSRQFDEDLAASLAPTLASRFSPQQTEDSIRFFETPLGGKLAHHEILNKEERQEAGRAVLADPAILQIQVAAFEAVLHAMGGDLNAYQKERGRKVISAFCAGLSKARIPQTGCPN